MKVHGKEPEEDEKKEKINIQSDMYNNCGYPKLNSSVKPLNPKHLLENPPRY